jgi:transaldolase
MKSTEVPKMKATQQLNEVGQSLWLDNITRDLLDKGTLERYIADLSVTGLTSNPTIFDHAITHSSSYDQEIRRLVGTGHSGEGLFFEIAVEDLCRAADLFAPIHQRTSTVTIGSLWRSRLLLMTPRQLWRRPSGCKRRRVGATCS